MTERDSLVLKFGDSDGTGDSDSSDCVTDISVTIDKTPCQANDTVLIYIYGSETELQFIKLFQENQDLGLGQLNIQNTTENENITFNNSTIAQTKYSIRSITSLIASTEILALNNKQIQSIFSAGSRIPSIKKGDLCVGVANVNQSLYGSMDIQYEANKVYKLYKWIAPNVENTTTFPFFVLDKSSELSEYEVSETFEVKVEKSLNQEVDIKFIVKDVANGQLIAGASVTILNQTQTTDNKGEVVFKLMQGQTYNIATVAKNYIDSNKDYLNNDVFTVPTADEA